MNVVDIVINIIGILLVIFTFMVLSLLFISIAEQLGYKIPNWIKKLKK